MEEEYLLQPVWGVLVQSLLSGGGVYDFVAAGLRYMLVRTGGGAAHFGGELHAGLATVGVVAMFASCCTCCPTDIMCHA